MFYRRKVLLALLEAFGRQVSRTDFQKYLFLLSQAQEHPSYHFVPYRYGCYSFNADADKRTLTRYGLVRDHDKWILASGEPYLAALKPADRTAVDSTVQRFKGLRGSDLLHHVYANHPYYAINSDISARILDAAQLRRVDTFRPNEGSPRLFTLGYEGLSLEQYLNRLIKNAVSVLCDVRRNAMSMKYGFSKQTLKQACDRLGVTYVHLPKLGVDSADRKHLRSRDDYDALLRHYCNTTLMENQDALETIADLTRDHGRVALTCFEADHTQCHRSRVADALLAEPGFRQAVSHL